MITYKHIIVSILYLFIIGKVSGQKYVDVAKFYYRNSSLNKNLNVYTRLGYSVGRSFYVYDQDDKISFSPVMIKVGDDRQQLNTDFSDGFMYQVTILYRLISV